MNDYRVNLDIYNGPLDLLLYLIRREEVDIHDIPIARITEQYCAYVDTLKLIDPDLAGEFLVMAATLMEIKTRMLLPRPQQEADEAEAFDPRTELVRQLLEYKAFKDAASELRAAADEQALRFPRRPVEIVGQDDVRDLEEVQLWDLVEAFSALMTAIGREGQETRILYDDTPLELHADDIMDRLRRDGNMTFREVFAGRTRRTELVGLFLALLELIRRRSIYVEQEKDFGEIYIFINPDAPPAADETDPERADRPADQTAPPPSAPPEPGEPAEAQLEGRYVSETPPDVKGHDDDERGGETQPTGH